MKFHLPDEEKSSELQAQILNHADVLKTGGTAIAQFENLSALIPRGRYDIKMHEKIMAIRGKSHDYKIPYKTIMKCFCLSTRDGMGYYFIVGLDPPLKQGQTRYPYLTLQFHRDDEIDLELNVEDDVDINAKYGDKVSREMSGPTFELFTACLKAIAKVRIYTQGETWQQISGRGPCLSCSFKANQGFLYPLEKAFIYVIKPKPIYVRFDEIHSVFFQKGGAKFFEFTIHLKKGAKGSDSTSKASRTVEFISLEREEYPRLFKFCQEKKVRIANLGKKRARH